MLHPSYSELMDKINSEADKDNMIESRYSIVMAAADRAREIIESRSIEEKIAKQLKNDPTATPEPVSYTHLDVYKRQDLSIQVRHASILDLIQLQTVYMQVTS